MHSLDVTCSAGDNVLNLLLDGPKRMSELRKTIITLSVLLYINIIVFQHYYRQILCTNFSSVAIDLSVAQNALLELKLAGIRCLCYEDYLILLGEVEDPGARWYV